MINRNTILAWGKRRSYCIIGSNHTYTKQALTVIKVLPAPFSVPFQHCTDGFLVQQKWRKQQDVLTAICSQEEGRHRKAEGKHCGSGARTPSSKQILDQGWALQAVAQGAVLIEACLLACLPSEGLCALCRCFSSAVAVLQLCRNLHLALLFPSEMKRLH